MFKEEFSDCRIEADDGTEYNIHTSILAKYFNSENEMLKYLEDINGQYYC